MINNTIFENCFLYILPVHNYTTRNRRINLSPIRLQVTVFQLCKMHNELSEDLLATQSKKLHTKIIVSNNVIIPDLDCFFFVYVFCALEVGF